MISVKAVKLKRRQNFVLRWKDRQGKLRQKTTTTTRRREAEREALKLETELNKRVDDPTWLDFAHRVRVERYGGARPKTLEAFESLCYQVERFGDLAPYQLSDLTASRISRLAARWRDSGLSPQSVTSYLSRLRTCLRWAKELQLIGDVPSFSGLLSTSKRKRHMRGRPLSEEEFERMLAAAEDLLDARCLVSWRFYLRGLWLSGLRLGESLDLQWTESDEHMHIVGIDRRRPMYRVWEETEKGKRDRLLPLTPDFVELLRTIPKLMREGEVFKLRILSSGRGKVCRTRSAKTVSKRVSQIGEVAGIIVERTTTKVRHATAHDLRRSFGERWSRKVRPVVLKELMRHESLETTMKYYVGENAVRTADEVWEAWSESEIRDQESMEGYGS